MKMTLTLAALATLAISPALAQSAAGTWMRTDGAAKVRFSSCGGDALCGSIAWLKKADGPAKVGQRVFFDMKPAGDGAWAGKAFNPEDGKTYTGKMTVSGDSMTTKGCVLGGMICKSVSWTRSN